MERDAVRGRERLEASAVPRSDDAPGAATVAEGRRLLEAFRSIACPQTRCRILNVVLSESNHEGPFACN